MTIAKPVSQRLWAMVNKCPTKRGCLLWTGYINHKGYGRITVKRGFIMSVHRLAWELVYGPIPGGLHVLHDCDIRRCVNVDHLFLGTVVDNNEDRWRKGKYVVGSKHHNAKLSERKVRRMKVLRAAGWTFQAIANKFHVSKTTAQRAIAGEIWGHVTAQD